MKHSCNIHYCEEEIPENLLLCRDHWNKVPAALRAQVMSIDKEVRRVEWLKAARAATACVKRVEYNGKGEFIMDECCAKEPVHLTTHQKAKVLKGVARTLASMGLVSEAMTWQASLWDTLARAEHPCAEKYSEGRSVDADDIVTMIKVICQIAEIVCPLVEDK